MNPFSESAGNESMSEGRDIPWLQDTDADQDDESDNFLTSWPFVYRDVVIVDANSLAVDTFNLTINSLEEPDSYATLRQMLIDVASGAIDAKNDSVAAVAGVQTDIDVLGNDDGLSRLDIQDITPAAHGTAEIVTVEYPADLDSIERRVPQLILSEIVPGEYIELYSSEFTEVDLETVDQVIVSGQQHISVSDLASGQTIPARGYLQLPWPAGMTASSASGEFVLYSDADSGFDIARKIDDFVAWGELKLDSRIELAREVGKWIGPPDGTLDEGAIQRIPGTLGDEVHSYDNHRPSTPGNAINDAIEVETIVRYTPDASYVGDDSFSYTVVDYNGNSDSATVSISVGQNARPWQNPVNKLDINNDGHVSPIDALAVINFLIRGFEGRLPTELNAPLSPQPFVDCNGDNFASPIDALLVINYLIDSNRAANTAQSAFANSNQVAAARPAFSENSPKPSLVNATQVSQPYNSETPDSFDAQVTPLPLGESLVEANAAQQQQSYLKKDLIDDVLSDESLLELL